MRDILKKLNIIFSKKEKLKIVYLSILSIASSSVDVLSIGLLIPLIGSILNDENILTYISFINNFFKNVNTENFLQFMLTVFILLIILKNLFQIFFSYILTKFLITISQSIQSKLYFNYINKEFIKLANIHTSDIFKDIDYESGVFTNGLLSPLVVMGANIILFISFTFFLLLYDFKVTIVICIIVTLLAFIFKMFLLKRIKILGYERQSLQKNYIKILKETFDIIREIKLLRIHKYFLKTFKQNLISVRLNGVKKSFIGSLTRPIIEVVFLTLFVFIIIVEMKNPENIIITLSIYAATAFRLMPSVNLIFSSYQKVKNSVSSLDKIKDGILDYNKFNQKKLENKIMEFKEDIKLENIDIKHFGNNELILQNISLNIQFGKKIGIMGSSGSGKTTLLNNIIGFIKPHSGKILVDGVVLDNSKLIENWQKLISYVPQNVVLFDKSLLENVTLSFDKKLNSLETKKYQNAILFAQLKNLQEKLEKSGESVGEMGSKVSRGEAQRIGIARAIYMGSKILILDESTNFLDEKTERDFLDIVKNYMKNITILFVSHKPKSLEFCDEIYKIENKKIVRIR